MSHSPPRVRCGQHLAETLSLPERQDKDTLSCLGGHLQNQGDIEPSPVVLGEQASRETNQTTLPANRHHACRPQCTRTQRADGERPPFHVRWCSQSAHASHELCPRTGSQDLLTLRSLPSWSQLIQRDATSLRCSFYLSSLQEGLGVGSAVQRRAAAPWRAWQSVIATMMAAAQSPDTDTLFISAPRLRAQLVQLQTTLSQQMNKPALLIKPLGAALRQNATRKKLVSSIQQHFHKQLLEKPHHVPVDRAVLLSRSAAHSGAHLMQPSQWSIRG